MIIALVGLSGCTSADSEGPAGAGASREPPRCFSTSRVGNIRVADSSTVHIRVGRDVYRLDMLGPCRDLNFTSNMRLVTSGSSTVCTGTGLGPSIVTRGATGQQRCQVQRITGLSAEQVAALPAGQRP
jgi:hypothetical protein